MEDPIIRIVAILLVLILLYFLIRMVLTWLRDFIGLSIPFSKNILIAVGIIAIFFWWQYPEIFQDYLVKTWEVMQGFYQNNF